MSVSVLPTFVCVHCVCLVPIGDKIILGVCKLPCGCLEGTQVSKDDKCS